MEITLPLVRKVINNVLGWESYVALFVERVVPNERIDTLCIDRNGTLQYNPEFCEKNVQCPGDLAFLVMHEFSHALFGHTKKDVEDKSLFPIYNLAQDTIINAFLTTGWGREVNYGAVIGRLTKDNKDVCFLQKDETVATRSLPPALHTMWQALYTYDRWGHNQQRSYSHEDIVRELIKTTKPTKVIYVCSHGGEKCDKCGGTGQVPADEGAGKGEGKGKGKGKGKGEGGGGEGTGGEGKMVPCDKCNGSGHVHPSTDLPDDILEKIADAMDGKLTGEEEQSYSGRSKMAGMSQTLQQFWLKAQSTRYGLDRRLLAKYATKRIIDKWAQEYHVQHRKVSVLPTHMSKRNLVNIALGIDQFWFTHDRTIRKEEQQGGIALFCDVSGSVADFVPQMLTMLQPLLPYMKNVYQFSTKIVKTPLNELLAGKIDTTGGTDFSCIAEEVLKEKYEKYVVLTDGYAGMSSSLQQQLKDKGVESLCLLIPEGRDPKLFTHCIKLDPTFMPSEGR